MAAIPGTRVTGTLVPTDTADTFPVSEPRYQIGGYRDVATIAERNAIPVERRREGMHVYVVATAATWALLGGIADANWSDVTPATPIPGGGVTDGDKGVIVVSGGIWGFDPTDVTTAAQAVLNKTTNAAMLTQLGAAPLASPTFTGTVQVPTESAADNSARAASTAHVKSVMGSYAGLASPAFTGTPTAPTATAGNSTTQLATTAFVSGSISDLIGAAPTSLNTLDELAASINDDPAFAATVATALGTKLGNAINQDKVWSRSAAGLGAVEEIAFTPYMRSLADDADATTARGTLGLGTLATRTKTLAGDYTTSSIVLTDIANMAAYTVMARLTSTGPPQAVASSVDALTLLQQANNAGMLSQLGAAPLASPAFTGTPTAPTAAALTNTTQLATTQFVKTAVDAVTGGAYAPLASPAFTGTPTAPTASAGTNTTQLATTAFARTEVANLNIANYAPLASPTFTGTPAVPTAAGGTNTTQIASTAFAQALVTGLNIANYAPLASPALTGTPTAPTASGATNTTQIATTAFVQGLVSPKLTNSITIDTIWSRTSPGTGVVTEVPFTSSMRALAAMTSYEAMRCMINRGVTTLTDGATITTDCAVGNVFQVTLGGSRALANPTNVQAGATYQWLIIQDGTGGRGLTLGSNFKLGKDDTGAAVTYTPTTVANEADLISVVARSTTNLVTTIVKGYAA